MKTNRRGFLTALIAPVLAPLVPTASPVSCETVWYLPEWARPGWKSPYWHGKSPVVFMDLSGIREWMAEPGEWIGISRPIHVPNPITGYKVNLPEGGF